MKAVQFAAAVLSLLLTFAGHSLAVTSYYKFRLNDVKIIRTGGTNIGVFGNYYGIIGRNITFGLEKGNFTVNGQTANLILGLANTHNTKDRLNINMRVYYDAKVAVNWTGVAELSITFSGWGNEPSAANFPGDTLESENIISYVELPWVGYVNKTGMDDKGVVRPLPYEVYLDTAGLGQTGKFNMTEGTYHSEISGLEAVVPSGAQIKKSRVVSRDFVGFAMEWSNAPWYFRQPGQTGTSNQINRKVVAFLKNLRYLNIGVNGNSGMLVYVNGTKTNITELAQYKGAKKGLLKITDEDFKMLDKVAKETGAKFIIGAPMMHPTDSSFIVDFVVRGVLKYMDPMTIQAIEFGNEPDHWSLGKKAFRPAPYTYDMYMQQFMRDTKAVWDAWPADKLQILGAAPAIAGCNNFAGKVCWQKDLADLAERSGKLVKYITYHRYGQSGCSQYSTPETLLGDPDPNSDEFEWIKQLLPKLDKLNKKLVWGEGNALSCGGKEEISDSFAAALWMLDNLFEAAFLGVHQSNIHADPTHNYSPLIVDQKTGDVQVMPVFYGMLSFTRLFENGDAAIFKLNSTVQSRFIKIWGVQNIETRNVRVVVIHKDLKVKGKLTLNIRIENPKAYEANAVVLRLTAPSASAKTGIKMAGQTFDGSTDGVLRGKYTSEQVEQADGAYKVTVDPVSAVLVLINRKSQTGKSDEGDSSGSGWRAGEADLDDMPFMNWVPDADPEADAAADGNDAAAEPEPEPEPEPVSIFGGFANKAALASGTDSGQGSEAAQDDGSGAAEGAGQVDGDAEPGTPTQ